MSPTPSIALQLYSLRAEVGEDPAGALARAAEVGFRQVELYNIVALRSQLETALPAAGLTAPTAHARLTPDSLEEVFEAASALGVATVIDPFTERERWATRDGVLRIADELAAAQELAAAHGLRIGYHNHFWETAARFDGVPALQVLASALPAEVLLEVDVYWAIVGGADEAALLPALGDRVRFLHVKDAPLRDGKLSDAVAEQLPAGEGAIDWVRALAAAPATELLVVEFDEYAGDIYDGIARSLAGVAALVEQ